MDGIIGVILAGGRARRMGGVDKALVPLAGRPLLAHVLERFRPQVETVVLSANGDPTRFAGFGLPVVADPFDDNVGPLAGIAAAGLWARAERPAARWLAAVSVDTPFLPPDLVARLAAGLEATPGARLAAAASAGRIHPTAALHALADLDLLVEGLRSGAVRRMMAWLADRGGLTVDFTADGCDPFANLNAPEDVDTAASALAPPPSHPSIAAVSSGSTTEVRTSPPCLPGGDLV